MKAGDKYTDHYGEFRVMAIAEGWVMVRRKGAVPFVLYAKDIKEKVNAPADKVVDKCVDEQSAEIDTQ